MTDSIKARYDQDANRVHLSLPRAKAEQFAQWLEDLEPEAEPEDIEEQVLQALRASYTRCA